jgi:putative flippase GtrA
VGGSVLSEDRLAPSRPPFLAKYGKFVIVGLTGVVVNLVVFTYTLDAISPGPMRDLYSGLRHFASTTTADPLLDFVASAVAFGGATLWNFTLNNLWTFRTTVGHRYRPIRRLGLYFGVSLGSLAVNEAVLFVAGFFVSPLLGQGIGIVAGSVVGFAGNYRYTFAEASLGPPTPEAP